jgi:polysaccharide export outer membrane protein
MIRWNFFGLGAILILFWGCSALNQNIMLRVPKDYQFDSAPAIPDSVYRISVNDILSIRILASDGADALGKTFTSVDRSIVVPVEFDGKIKLPVIGRVTVGNLTRRAVEDSLESWFGVYYVDPFVRVAIENRQVIVFPGTGSNAQVVKFERENMNVFEALARVGGISPEGKAHRIKLIRGDLKNPLVIKIDLSTIEGMKSGDLTLQSGDIIYVDTRENFATIFTANFQPYLMLLTSTMSIATAVILISSLGK